MPFFENHLKSIDSAIHEHFSTDQENPLKKISLYALMSGGRRIRPISCLLMAESLGLSKEKALFAALAIEFFHTASLIADDLPCMDDDDIRRGQPSTHAKFGQAAAVLATYALIAEGYGLLSKADSAHLSMLLEETTLATGFSGASQGQLLDLDLPDQEFATMQEMVEKKTGSLFELSFVYGWIIGGGAKEKIPSVRKAASHFGFAFQLYDDLEDIHQSGANFASLVGSSNALDLFQTQLEHFKKALFDLGLSNTALFELSNFFSVLSDKKEG